MQLTLTQAQAMLDAYIEAEKAVLKGQEYTISGRTLRRADLPEIIKGRLDWQTTVSELEAQSAGGGRRWGVSRASF